MMKMKLLAACMLFAAQIALGVTVDVTRAGAKPDGQTLCTEVIQKAIDKCSAAGGGEVLLPAGLYLSGTLYLKDNVTLRLEAGATLLGSTRMEDYDPYNLIRATGAENIAIVGEGTLDGRGSSFWVAADLGRSRRQYGWVTTFRHDHPTDGKGRRLAPGNLILLTECRNVRIEGVTLRDSESWTVNLLACDEVMVRGVKIRNYLHGPNTDGIDIVASRNVTISDCDIYTADDAIVLKNRVQKYWSRTCENITVTNCILTSSCNGFKIGTETLGDFRNIVFSNSVIKAGRPDEELARTGASTIQPDHWGNALAPLAGIAIESVDGSRIDGVSVSNIVMDEVRAPIFIRLGARNAAGDKSDKPCPGSIRNVSVSDVIARGASTASSVTAVENAFVENVVLDNVLIHTKGGGTEQMAAVEMAEKRTSYPEATMWGHMPVSGLYVKNVKGMRIDGVQIFPDEADKRPLVLMENAAEVSVTGFVTGTGNAGASVFLLKGVRDVWFRDVRIPEAAPAAVWFEVTGGSEGVSVDTPQIASLPSARVKSGAADKVSVR